MAPVLYEGAPDDRGYLITRQGDRVLTSVTLHLAFIRARRAAAGPNYRELIRLLKAWIREAKRNDADLRCKSFLLELIVAHLWDQGWNGEPLAVDDYPRAFEQVLGYIARTGLRTPVIFTDFYARAEVTQTATRSRSGTRSTRRTTSRGPTPNPTGSVWSRQRPPRWRRSPGPRWPDQGRGQRRLADRAGPGIRGGMMTATATRTATFTITDARYVGAKVGADLRLLNILYGRPSLETSAISRRKPRCCCATATSARSITGSGTRPRTRGSCGSATPRPRAATSSTTAPASSPPGRPSPDTPFAATSPTARPSTPSPRRSRTRSVTPCPSTASEPTNQ